MKNIKERFFSKIKKTKKCWLWIAGKDLDGYGHFWLNGKTIKAHRLSYCLFNKNSIPKKICIMHKCDNPSCVNPKHLIAGTMKDNMDDKNNKKRGKYPGAPSNGMCKKGHKHSDKNTYFYKRKNGKGIARACKICSKEYYEYKKKIFKENQQGQESQDWEAFKNK